MISTKILNGTLKRVICLLPEYSQATRLFSSERPWEDPWKEALPQTGMFIYSIIFIIIIFLIYLDKTYTDYQESSVNWDYVQRLLPQEIIPPMPTGPGPYPSGWKPPLNPPPDLPYYIGRGRFHLPELYLERRRDKLNPNTMDFEYVELVTLKGITGDVFACEADLKQFVEDKVEHPIATYVDELKGLIKIKGAPKYVLEQFVFNKGF